VSGEFTPAEVVEFDDLETMDVLAHPLRLKLLDAFRMPATVKDAAGMLEVPVTRLYHHVNQLVEHGLLVVTEERPKGALTERVFCVAANSFRPSPAFFERYGRDGQAEVIRLAFRMAETEMTESAAADRTADGLEEVPRDRRASIAVSALRLNPSDLADLITDIEDVLARYSKVEGSVSVGFFHAVYPRVTTHG
jgi:hypothetical protein